MVDYLDTRIGFKPNDHHDGYVERQLHIELERLELARKKRIVSARNSFVSRMQDIVAQVGRGFGYHILIPRIKIVRLYKWLFDY
jgi:hypothetical protein